MGGTMKAMVLDSSGGALRSAELPRPSPGVGQILVRVRACGVCRTDLHILDGDLAEPKLPLVLGHQVVGTVEALGSDVDRLAIGDRVGLPWLGWTCGRCRYCRSARENLCERARFTGYQLDGGYAEFALADARYAFPIPSEYADAEAAPLLCAGALGYRCLRLAGEGERLGLYGFGSAARIVAQVARYQHRRLFVFTREGDEEGRRSARELGAEWAGGSTQRPPEELDAAIVFAPAGELVPQALRAIAPGGTVVCGEIHMSDIPSFPYELLWRERVLRSVANLTRQDVREFLELAPKVPVRTRVTTFSLEQANDALGDMRAGKVRGSVVLLLDSSTRTS